MATRTISQATTNAMTTFHEKGLRGSSSMTGSRFGMTLPVLGYTRTSARELHCPWKRSGGLERPDAGNDDHGGNKTEDVERNSDFEEISETVSADSIHVGVGLIADRCGEGRGGGEH